MHGGFTTGIADKYELPSQRCNLSSCALIFRDVDQQFPMLFGYVTNSKNALFSLTIGDRPVWVCGLGICGANCVLVLNTDTPNDSSHSPPVPARAIWRN